MAAAPVLRTDRAAVLAVDPSGLWALLLDPTRYPAWWPWLQDFDGRRLAVGETWTCTIQPPLPYRVRCSLTITTVTVGEAPEARPTTSSGTTHPVGGAAPGTGAEEPALEAPGAAEPRPARLPAAAVADVGVAGVGHWCVTATVAGDIHGTAGVTLAPATGGTEVHLTSALSPSAGWLAALTRLARPVATWGHDQVVDRAIAQLAAALPVDPDGADRSR